VFVSYDSLDNWPLAIWSRCNRRWC